MTLHVASNPLTESTAGDIEADLNYLASDSHINRRFVSPGLEINTGRYELHRVIIRSARPFQDHITLDTHGFQLVRSPSAVRDFTAKAEVDEIYGKEVEALIRSLTGATRVVLLGGVVRTADAYEGGPTQAPAADVHVDFFPRGTEERLKAAYNQHFPSGAGFKRAIAFSVWRTFSPPPQNMPLALCDGTSVREDDDGVPNTMIRIDKMPDENARMGEWPGEEKMPTASVFHYDPAHRWWYFPDMIRDEVLIFKFYDSDRTKAWRCPHTAFRLPEHLKANTRRSIEYRIIAFFE